MERYNSVKQWLIDNERYEDIIKFDQSENHKELFRKEMISNISKTSYHSSNDSYSRISELEEIIKIKEDVIKHKDYVIKSLEKDNDTLKYIIKGK